MTDWNSVRSKDYGSTPLLSAMEDESIRDGRSFEMRWNESLRFNSVIFREIRSLEGESMIPGETILSQKAIDTKPNPHFSEFRVMSTGAGWYIGTMFLACGEASCKDCKEYTFDNLVLTKGQELDHNSRETDYFGTKEKAEAALETYKKTGELPGQRY